MGYNHFSSSNHIFSSPHAFCFIQSYEKIAKKKFSWKFCYALDKHTGKKKSVIWESLKGQSFWCLQFPPKNERSNSTLLLWYPRSTCFCSFLEEIDDPKYHFEIILPLINVNHTVMLQWKWDTNKNCTYLQCGVECTRI